MPSMGELIFMPFHVTCVCEGAVPRNEAVAIVPRPYDLMNTGVLCDSRSPKLGDSQTVPFAALREAVVSVSAAARAVLYSRFIAIVI